MPACAAPSFTPDRGASGRANLRVRSNAEPRATTAEATDESRIPNPEPRAMTTHNPVHAADLPAPVGPYSPGMEFEGLIFVSGQGATDPATGKLAATDIEGQTEQCLKNIQAILEAAGSGLQHVLRCGVFLVDMRESLPMTAGYAR